MAFFETANAQRREDRGIAIGVGYRDMHRLVQVT